MEEANQTIWYKKTGGRVFLAILFFFFALVIIFGGLIGYYLWKIKFDQGFNFSELNNNTDLSSALISDSEKDVSKYIRLADPQVGSIGAPVTILAFMDFDCAVSHSAYPAFWAMRQKYEPVVKIVYKTVSFTETSSAGFQSALASTCAKDQNKFEEYFQALFGSGQSLEKEALLQTAKDIGLDMKIFSACLNSQKNISVITQNNKDAVEVGLRGTPTFLVNNKKIEGNLNNKKWDEILVEVMTKKD